jgi:dTDP-glucose 4,6-dehydratase
MEIYADFLPNNTHKIGTRFYLNCDNHADVFKFLSTKPVSQYSQGAQRPDRYNVTGEIELNNLEMAQLVAEIMGKELHYNLFSAELMRKGYDRRYSVDGTKLANLGWKPPLDFRKGLEKIVKWTLDHPWWIS